MQRKKEIGHTRRGKIVLIRVELKSLFQDLFVVDYKNTKVNSSMVYRRRYRQECCPIPTRRYQSHQSVPYIRMRSRKNGNLLPFETKLCSSPFFGEKRSYLNLKKDTHLKHKEDDYNRKSGPTIQRRTQHIIKLAPPRKILLPNQVLEYEPNKEPRTIIDSCSRWNSRQTSNDNRRAHVARP